jgi:hypothetical protein
MQIKRCALALAVTAALSTAAVTGAANLRADTMPTLRAGAQANHVAPHFRFPNRLRPADTVLYSQMGTIDSGAPSQDMQAALDTSDALAADDFVVPDEGWAISGFNFGITIGGDLSTPAPPPAGTVYDIAVYADDGGKPGTVECDAPGLTGTVDAANTGLSVTLPTACTLTAGTHWVSMRAVTAFPPMAFWLNETGGAINNAGVWENPGDAYESGCVGWSTLATCTGSSGSLIGSGNANFLFEVIGSVGNGAECNDGLCLTTTVSADLTPDVCGRVDTIEANVGDQLNFCYTITNDTGHDLDFHTLANNVDGTLLSLTPQHVADGGTFSFNHIETVGASATYTSTWTAQDFAPGYAATVEGPAGISCSDLILKHGFDGPAATCDAGNFVDITTTGTALNLGDDDAAGVTVPFSFTLYGTTSNQLCVSNNGFATLGLGDCSLLQDWFFLNTALPSDDLESLGAPAIMPLWDDFSDTQGNVYTAVRGASPNREFIVEWSDLAHFDGDSNIDGATFEVIFGEDGALKFEYADVTYTALNSGVSGDPDDCTGGVCATIGLQKDGSLYNEFSSFDASVSDRSGIAWAATHPQVATATDSVTVTTHAPQIVINPSPLAGTVPAGGASTVPFAVENHGDADLIWSLSEAGASKTHFPPPGSRYAMPIGDPAKATTGRVPAEFHRNRKASQGHSSLLPFSGPVIAFATDLTLQQMETFDASNPVDVDEVAPVTDGQAFVGSAFVNNDFSKAFAIDGFGSTSGMLYSIDMTSGSIDSIGDASGVLSGDETFTGMTFDPRSGKTFLASSNCADVNRLWTVDVSTGTATLVGSITGLGATTGGLGCVIAIASNAQGEMYALDIASDALFAIDSTTAEGALIGSVGFDMNFAQDAAFDQQSGVLYLAGFDNGSRTNGFFTVDVTTGLATAVAPVDPASSQIDALAIETAAGPCSEPEDLPWLSIDRTGGTVIGGDSAAVVATIDATGAAAGDVLSGTVCAHSNDPAQRVVGTPITVTVSDGTVTPPTATPSFTPTTIDTNGTSTLTITLANANGTAATLTSALTDTLPTDLVVAATPNASTTCGGIVTADAGTGTVSLDATGAAIPANGSCTIKVDVASAAPDDYTITIAAGDLQTSAGANAADASATLSVTAAALAPTLTKAFAPDSVEPGEISTLTITLGNLNATAITMTAALTDTLPNGLVVAATPNVATDCGGPVTADAGATSVSLDPTGVAINGAGTCTVTVDVTAAAAAVLTNTMPPGALQTSAGTNAAPAEATLTVTDPVAPTVAVALSPTSVATDAPSTLTFTFSNPNGRDATLSAAFSNTLPNGLLIAAAPNAATTCGGVLTANAGDDTLTLDPATSVVPANDACTVTVDVAVALPGVYSPTVDLGDLQTSEGANVIGASDNVVVTGTFPEPYCAAEATVAVEPITSVSLAGVDNASSATIGAGGTASESEDFTAVTGIAVKPGSTYPIVVKGNTNGAFADTVHVFVDWNHDGDFTGAEDIDLGAIDTSTGADAIELDADVAIPADAKVGLTRMRIVKARTLTNGACGDLANGQAEDYLIDVDPNAP